jgi:uncharacterized iron-regulated protein
MDPTTNIGFSYPNAVDQTEVIVLSYSKGLKEIVSPQRAKIIPSIPSNNGIVSISEDVLLTNLINVNPGVFMGDSHTEFNCSEFMASKMNLLSRRGVGLFFMEMFGSSAQPLLNRYFEKGDNLNALVSYLKERGWDKRPGMAEKYCEIVKAAKENGIRIIGIDNDAYGRGRLEESNPHWVSVINKYTEKKGTKYIIFGGGGHSANYSLNKGVDYLLGIPSVDLNTGEKQKILLGDGKANDFSIDLIKSPNQPPE